MAYVLTKVVAVMSAHSLADVLAASRLSLHSAVNAESAERRRMFCVDAGDLAATVALDPTASAAERDRAALYADEARGMLDALRRRGAGHG